MSNSFVHLHLHTSYSLLDGSCRPDEVMSAVVLNDMRAVAVTDHGAMYGVVEFYLKARQRGIKPIIGCETYVAAGSRRDRSGGHADKPSHLVLIAQNDLGYFNLMQIVSKAHTEGFYYKPRVDKELIYAHHRGLIGLSGCWGGDVARHLLNGETELAIASAGEYADILGEENFFLEMQDHGTEEERTINRGLLELARKTGLRVVATNDVHYLRREDAGAHEVLLCLQTQDVISNPRRMRLPTSEYYFKSSQEMAELFREVPEAIGATVEIADRCDVELRFGEIHFPQFAVPPEHSAKSFLAELCREGIGKRYGVADPDTVGAERERTVVERYRYELDIIERTGFLNYFLVVWDFVRFARERGIPVWLRGSGGASLVAYVLGITDIDPLRYSLVFERFLNPERVSPPDFDMDFCQLRRGEVIEYIRSKYGSDRVAHIMTFGSLGARQVIRDVGRVLEIPYGYCDRLAKMIPDEPGISLKDALKRESGLRREYDTSEDCRRILEFGFVLEGLYRNTGTHAAGLVISEKPLSEIVPLSLDKNGELVTQYSMEPLGEIGLLKMDILGLRTLSVIQEAVDLVRQIRGITLDLNALPEDDKATFALFNRGDTVGVFQLESDGMRELIRRVGIDRIEDLTAMIALYRPGPMNMLDEYVNRKSGRVEKSLDHPLLQPILAETYGVMVYQEQVQRAASALAGYSLGQGDILRRAMGKKDAAAMERQRAEFIAGCRKTNKIPAEAAGKIFDTLARFAGYGFNKSHSTAYAALAYRTAYLKANYPSDFMAALLSSEIHDAERLRFFIAETRGMGLELLPPDINESGVRFRPSDAGIRFGLSGIRNIGDAAVDAIVREREQNGAYEGLLDFCMRVDSHTVNRRTIESLARSGCFDFLGIHRARIRNGIEFAMTRASALRRDRESGQRMLFDVFSEAPLDDARELPDCEPWHENQLLGAEKELLGFYISGHPLSKYAPLLERYKLASVDRLLALPDGTQARIGGIISRVEMKTTRKGREMAVIELEDLDGSIEVTVFPDVFAEHGGYLELNAAILVLGQFVREDPPRIHASWLCALVDVPAYFTERISVHIAASHLDEAEVGRVRTILSAHPGPVPVVICLEFPKGEKVFVDTDRSFTVKPTEDLIRELEHTLGEKSVYVAASQERVRAVV